MCLKPPRKVGHWGGVPYVYVSLVFFTFKNSLSIFCSPTAREAGRPTMQERSFELTLNENKSPGSKTDRARL